MGYWPSQLKYYKMIIVKWCLLGVLVWWCRKWCVESGVVVYRLGDVESGV